MNDDLLRALYHSGILNDNIEMIDDLFDACDIKGGPDGRISFDEIREAVDNMGVFAKPPKAGEPPLAEGQITLDDLEKVLSRVDIVADRQLDKVEFMLLALDRKTLFSEENITALFNHWDRECLGHVSIGLTLRLMLALSDGSESQEKLDKFYGGLESQAFCPSHDNDLITLNNFFVICRDLFGLNTFDFEEDVYH